ncbi:MAG: AmmeMemoRadiSam system protein B [Blastocatellia bacterium]|nr:AmmeMemoRadiSam system protein B [Blastocatellia bacterium]
MPSLVYPLPARPRLRHLNVIPVELNGERLIAIQDPQQFTEPIAVSEALGVILLLCDGLHTPQAIHQLLVSRLGAKISLPEVLALLEKLDEWLLLDSDRFAAHSRRIKQEFISAPVRPGVHAGASYPAEPKALQARLDEILAAAPETEIPEKKLVGLIAPHIDLRVGGRAYAPAYRTLHQGLTERLETGQPLTVIILGTSHYGGEGLFIGSRKDFETPLGRIGCDTEFLDRLETRLGNSISADDTAHRQEHSIEFQVVFLQHLFGPQIAAGQLKIVPLLVTSFQALLDENFPQKKADERAYQAFVAALRTTLTDPASGQTCLLVGGDLAHIGRKFGDPFDAVEMLDQVAKADAELLEVVCTGNASALLAHIARDQDARKVCGFPPMLTLLDVLDTFGNCEGRMLHYEQWHEEATSSAVTYASWAFFA